MFGCGVGVVAVAWRGVGGCPAITFGRGAGVRIWVRSVIISLFLENLPFFGLGRFGSCLDAFSRCIEVRCTRM